MARDALSSSPSSRERSSASCQSSRREPSLALPEREDRAVDERERAQRLRRVERCAEDAVEEAAALAQVAADDPEPARGDREPDLELELARLRGPGERGPQVVVLLVEQGQEGVDPDRRLASHSAAAASACASTCRQCRRRRASASPDSSSSSAAYSRIVSSIANRGSPVGRRSAPDEALVDERRQRLEDVEALLAADGLGRIERPAAGEDGEPGEERALLVVEQPWLHSSVARSVRWRPGRSCAPPTSRSSARSRRRLIVSGGRSFERAAASSIASGSPSSRPQTCGDRRDVVLVELEVRVDCAGTGCEQPYRVVRHELLEARGAAGHPGARAAAPGTRARRRAGAACGSSRARAAAARPPAGGRRARRRARAARGCRAAASMLRSRRSAPSTSSTASAVSLDAERLRERGTEAAQGRAPRRGRRTRRRRAAPVRAPRRRRARAASFPPRRAR